MDEKDIVNLIPLNESTNELAQQIIDEKDLEKVKDLTHLFNLNQAKKNVLRVIKLNSLLDKVSDQMIDRFNSRPGEFSNTELLNYMQVTQNAIDRANKSLNLVDESPAITLNQVNVNIEEGVLDRESRAKITEAINKILQKSKELDIVSDQQEAIIIPEEGIKEQPIVEETNNTNILLNEEE